jgi:hypothetical protein
VSPVVAVVISFVTAAPPWVRLQPPKVYPLRVVTTVRDSDSVETLSESAETRVDASDAGTEVAKVLPSKMMLGLAAVVALADIGIAISPEIVSRPVRTIAVVLLDSDMVLELSTLGMAFPSMALFVLLKINSRPATRRTLVPTGYE